MESFSEYRGQRQHRPAEQSRAGHNFDRNMELYADHLQGGFIAYTKASKTKSLGVPAALLKRQGAVCRDVAIAMAEGGSRTDAGERGRLDYRRGRSGPR